MSNEDINRFYILEKFKTSVGTLKTTLKDTIMSLFYN